MRSKMHFPLTLSLVQDKKCPSLCLPAGMQKAGCPKSWSGFASFCHHRVNVYHRVSFITRYGSYRMTFRRHTNRHIASAWQSVQTSNIDWSKIYQIHEKELCIQRERLTFFFLFGNFAIFTFMMRIKSDASVFIRLARIREKGEMDRVGSGRRWIREV